MTCIFSFRHFQLVNRYDFVTNILDFAWLTFMLFHRCQRFLNRKLKFVHLFLRVCIAVHRVEIKIVTLLNVLQQEKKQEEKNN